MPSALAGSATCWRTLRPVGIPSPQNPLRLPAQESVPQPDVVVLRRRADFGARPPGAEDVLLLVEVADSSHFYDRKRKLPLYAENGIPETWLVDLNSDAILVHRRPAREGIRGGAYRRGESISPQAFPDKSFAVDEILGLSAR